MRPLQRDRARSPKKRRAPLLSSAPPAPRLWPGKNGECCYKPFPARRYQTPRPSSAPPIARVFHLLRTRRLLEYQVSLALADHPTIGTTRQSDRSAIFAAPACPMTSSIVAGLHL